MELEVLSLSLRWQTIEPNQDLIYSSIHRPVVSIRYAPICFVSDVLSIFVRQAHTNNTAIVLFML
jgi:hypothetical protein